MKMFLAIGFRPALNEVHMKRLFLGVMLLMVVAFVSDLEQVAHVHALEARIQQLELEVQPVRVERDERTAQHMYVPCTTDSDCAEKYGE